MRRHWILAGFALAVSAAPFAHTEPPSGSYAIAIPGDPSIVVLNEIDDSSCETADGVTICFSGDLTTDGSGSIHGTGILGFSGEIDGELAGSFAGRLSGTAGNPRLRLAIVLEGELSSEGETLAVEATSRSRCAVDPFAGGFACAGPIKMCVFDGGRRLGCESENVEFYVEDDGGPWQLTLDLATDEAGVVTGTADVELSTGQVLGHEVTGRYSSVTDTSSLRLVGVGSASGSKLRLASLSLAGEAATGGSSTSRSPVRRAACPCRRRRCSPATEPVFAGASAMPPAIPRGSSCTSTANRRCRPAIPSSSRISARRRESVSGASSPAGRSPPTPSRAG